MGEPRQAFGKEGAHCPSFPNACRGSPTEVTGYPPWIYLQWLCVIRYALWGDSGTFLLRWVAFHCRICSSCCPHGCMIVLFSGISKYARVTPTFRLKTMPLVSFDGRGSRPFVLPQYCESLGGLMSCQLLNTKLDIYVSLEKCSSLCMVTERLVSYT